MFCSKCGETRVEKDFYCKKCGKIFKIKCPQCNTINYKAVCKRCKMDLLIKCKRCGHPNAITSPKCYYCHGSFVSSIKDVPVVCLELSNYEQVKKSFNDIVSFETFMNSLYLIIQTEVKKYGTTINRLKSQRVSIKLNILKSEEEACLASINLALKLAEYMQEINTKLTKSNNLALKIRIAITAISNYDRRADSRLEMSIFTKESLEIIVHPQIYKNTRNYFKFESLVTVMNNNEFLTFYKLIPEEVEKEGTASKKQAQENYEELEYKEDNSEKIDFSSKKAKKYIIKSSKLQLLVKDLIEKAEVTGQASPNSLRHAELVSASHDLAILKQVQDDDSTIVKPDLLQAESSILLNIISEEKEENLAKLSFSALQANFKDYKFIDVCCNKSSNLYPFALFRSMFRYYFDLGDIDPVSINEEKQSIEKDLFFIDSTGLQEFKSLLYYEKPEKITLEEVRANLFFQIRCFFEKISQKQKIFFFIEDFQNIDRGSFDCFKYLIENGILMHKNISFILFTDKAFNLSEKFFKLNYLENYKELIVRPNTRKESEDLLKPKFEVTANNYYYNLLVKNSNGSVFYMDQLMHYFIENEVLSWNSGVLSANLKKLIPCPLTLEEIISKRMDLLSEKEDLFVFYLTLIILGPRINFINALGLGFQGLYTMLNILKSMDLLDYSKTGHIQLKNYNLFKNYLVNKVEKDRISQLAELMYKKLFPLSKTVPVVLSEFIDFKANDQKWWNDIAELGYRLGDVAAYSESSLRSVKNLPNYKSGEILPQLYEEIAKAMYKSYPDTALNYLNNVINHARVKNDNDRLIQLSKVMAQNCNLAGNYTETINCTGKIILLSPSKSLIPNSKNFNFGLYLLNYPKIQALFNIGKLHECVELGLEFLSVLKNPKNSQFIDNYLSGEELRNCKKILRY